MSDRRHTQRPALPEGYQFGDAALGTIPVPPKFYAEAFIAIPGEAVRQEKKYRLDGIYGVTCSTCWRDMTYDRLRRVWACCGCGGTCYPARSDAQHQSNIRIFEMVEKRWRAQYENAAVQLSRRCASSVQQGGSTVPCDCQRTGDEKG